MAWLEGHVDEHGATWWTVRWRDSKTGRKSRRRLGPLPKEAAQAACERIAATEEGRLPRASSVTHRQALARFLRHLRFLRRSAETVRYYDGLLSPLFDELAAVAAMKRWHPGHLQEVLARHTTWSPRTVQMHLSACRRFVRWARRARVTVPDFVEDLRGPKVTVREVVAYTPDEVAKILRAAEGTHVEVPVSLALLAGLALGDLRALDWGDVSFERPKRGGPPTMAWIRRRRAKTGQPVEVAVRGPLVELLAEQARPSGLVCAGLPADKNNAKRSLQRLLARAGVARGGWHRCRHSAGALLAAAGADLATIARALGHAPGSIMTLRYVHTDTGRLAAAAMGVERLVSAAAECEKMRRAKTLT